MEDNMGELRVIDMETIGDQIDKIVIIMSEKEWVILDIIEKIICGEEIDLFNSQKDPETNITTITNARTTTTEKKI